MKLLEQIGSLRKDIRTDRYSMSIGEWINLYTSGELDIHPEFQRFYRWSDEQKSKLIESLLLGIPIPQIFVSQREDGVWDVVDGLQRLSTIFEFMGILKDENNKDVPPLKLQATRYLPDLEGKYWDNEEEPDNSLPHTLRLIIKREKFDVSIVLKESDEKSKYELFQRLNTGGSSLTPQEVRNCMLIMINRDAYVWLRDLSKYEAFRQCISITDKAIEEQYDMELALRAVLFRTMDLGRAKSIADVNDFITDEMISFAEKPINYAEEEKAFKRTFDILAQTIGENAFKKYDSIRDRFIGGFLLSAFEVVSSGLSYNYEHISKYTQEIETTVKKLWSEEVYTKNSGSGVRASSRIPKLLELGRHIFNYEA